jgi:hypothetical protein
MTEFILTVYLGAAIDCATTSTCASNVQELNQTCTTTGSTWTNGMDWKILDASVELDTQKFGKISLGGSMNYQHSLTSYNTQQVCTATTTNQ